VKGKGEGKRKVDSDSTPITTQCLACAQPAYARDASKKERRRGGRERKRGKKDCNSLPLCTIASLPGINRIEEKKKKEGRKPLYWTSPQYLIRLAGASY